MIKTLRAAGAALALTLALPACAQGPAAKAPQAANDADPALWVVKDADTTIYLFGTIHVLKPGLTWFDEAVKTAFDKSDELKLELVMPDPATMQKIVLATGTAPAGTTPLTEQLPARQRPIFTKAVVDLGLPANALDKYRPWLAATTLSVTPLGKMGFDAANGPEQVLTAAAQASGKKVTGLETAEQQLGFFAGLSAPAQLKFLSSTIDELPTLQATMTRMVDDWAAGKPDALAKELNDDLKDTPEVAKVLLVDRNKRWAAWVKQRLGTPGTVFVAVGAGHLAGGDSVLAQLAKTGVKARRIAY